MHTKVLSVIAAGLMFVLSASGVTAQSISGVNNSCTDDNSSGVMFSVAATGWEMVDCPAIQRLEDPFNIKPKGSGKFVIESDQIKVDSVFDGSGMDDNARFANIMENSEDFYLLASVTILVSERDGIYKTIFFYTPRDNIRTGQDVKAPTG